MEDGPIGSRPYSLTRYLPWLVLVKAVGGSIDGRSLALSVLGLILLWIGWSGLDRLFDAPGFGPLVGPETWANRPGFANPDLFRWGEPTEPFRVLTAPFARLFSLQPGWGGFCHALLAAVWVCAVWGIIGGAISRVTAVRIAVGQRVGIWVALGYAWKRAVGLIGAPLSPLLGIGFFAFLCGLMGLLYRIPGSIGETVAGLFGFLPLLAGLVMALLLIGLAVGWPLMVATVAVEGEDAFDALSRSYSYVYQRPALFTFYAAVAWVVGLAGSLVVGAFAALVVHLAQWGLSFGAPLDRVVPLQAGAFARLSPTGGFPGPWLTVVALIAKAWIYSYFWTASTIIYLLLRNEVDGASFHDVAGAVDSDLPPSPVEIAATLPAKSEASSPVT